MSKSLFIFRKTLVVLFLTACTVHGAYPIEALQRSIWQRTSTSDTALANFPPRSDGAAPGNMPSDGFYGADLESPAKLTSLVDDLVGRISGLSSIFIPEQFELEGSNPETVSIPNLRKVIGSAPPSSDIPGRIAWIQKGLKRMKKKWAQVFVVKRFGRDVYEQYNHPGATCQDNYDDILAKWSGQPWGYRGDSMASGGLYNQVLISFVSSTLGYSETEHMTYTFRRMASTKGVLKFVGGSSIAQGEVRFYGRATVFGEATLPNAPIPCDNLWHSMGSVSGSGDLYSDEIGAEPAPNSADCGTFGWSADRVAGIFTGNYLDSWVNSCNDCSGCSSTSLGSLKYSYSLGNAEFGLKSVSLYLETKLLQDGFCNPKSVSYHSAEGCSLITDPQSGQPIQFKTPSTLAIYQIISRTKFKILIFPNGAITGLNPNGSYVTVGEPANTITVENPVENSIINYNTVLISEGSGQQQKTARFAYQPNTGSWTLSKSAEASEELLEISWNAAHTEKTESRTLKTSTGEILKKTNEIFRVFPWGNEIVSTVDDVDGIAKTTNYSYFEIDPVADVSQKGKYSQMKSKQLPDGYWETYDYDVSGRIIKLVAQWGNSGFQSDESLNRSVVTFYQSSTPFTIEVERILGLETKRKYSGYTVSGDETLEAISTRVGGTWIDPTNLSTRTSHYTQAVFSGRPKSIWFPDGTLSLYTYTRSSDNLYETVIVNTGEPNAVGTAVTRGTTTQTTKDRAGNILWHSSGDLASGLTISSEVSMASDGFGRPTQKAFEDGSVEYISYDCCGVDSVTDRLGNTTTYSHDAAGRVISESRNGLSTLSEYDALGRIIKNRRLGTDNSLVTVFLRHYDLLGRLDFSSDSLNRPSTYTEFIDSNGYTTRTTTFPSGYSEVRTSNSSGQLLSVGGTGAHPLSFEYGVESIIVGNKTFNAKFVKEIRLGESGTSAEWTKTYTDMAGRTCRIVSSSGATSEALYNDLGQLVRRTDPDGVSILHGYNGMGELEVTCLDMDRNGLIDEEGEDRITKAQRSFAEREGKTVQRSVVSQLQSSDSSDPTVVSTTDVSSGGLQSWQTNFGLTTTIKTTISSTGRNTVVTSPDGSKFVQTYSGDWLIHETWLGVDGAELGSHSITYDPHGRVKADVDARNGETIYSWFDDDQLRSVTTPVAGEGRAAQTNTFVYDFAGRKEKDILADGSEINYSYWPSGELKRKSGSLTYPQEYTYDSQGRVRTLTTWQDSLSDSGTAITTWNYDTISGFLIGKSYNNGQGTVYSYTPAGRLQSRIGQRGITTTYRQNNAGETEGISYTDGTPNVSMLYDRAGRLGNVVDAGGSRSTSYTVAGQLDGETFSFGLLAGTSINPGYDSLLRRDSLEVSMGENTVLSQGYTYGAGSRLQSITNGSQSFYYSYLPNSQLLETTQSKYNNLSVLTRTSSYDFLDQPTLVTNSRTAPLIVSVGYEYNQTGQRTKLTREDGSSSNVDYDSMGQVTRVEKKLSNGDLALGEQFSYTYDDIGNRKTAVVNGKESTYSSDLLNQIEERTIPSFAGVLGDAEPAAEVTVNEQTVVRQDRTYYHDVPAENSFASANLPLNISGASGTDSMTRNGSIFVAKTPEIPTYDGDGNLTSDSRWLYTWDGENRLVGMETSPAAVAAGVFKQKLLFAYDYAGRRIQKQVFTWSASKNSFHLSRQSIFVWDGWNLVAENTTSGSLQQFNLKTYVWGIDMSGSLQGAGGVEGLLAENISFGSKTVTLFPSYDGNGDILNFIDPANESIAAEYEYGPFGEPIKSVGAYAEANPYRWSSKYTDEETGLVYYGYRYYDTTNGRWLSKDPLGEEGGVNLYGFVGNHAVSQVDPLGLSAFSDVAFIGGNLYLDWNRISQKNAISSLVKIAKGSFNFVADGLADRLEYNADPLAYFQRRIQAAADAQLLAEELYRRIKEDPCFVDRLKKLLGDKFDQFAGDEEAIASFFSDVGVNAALMAAGGGASKLAAVMNDVRGAKTLAQTLDILDAVAGGANKGTAAKSTAASRAFWTGVDGELAARASGAQVLKPSQAALNAAKVGDWSVMRAESGQWANGATGDVPVFFGNGKGRIFLNDELPRLLKNMDAGTVKSIDISF